MTVNRDEGSLSNRHRPALTPQHLCFHIYNNHFDLLFLTLAVHPKLLTMGSRDLFGHADKRKLQQERLQPQQLPFYARMPPSSVFSGDRNLAGFSAMDELASGVVPAVTVVLEGRSICQRICLHKLSSYQSFARALRQMYVDVSGEGAVSSSPENELEFDLSNAIPGHFIAYEDMEDDLLLAGDLKWKDFVRVAKRIRILPAKSNNQHRKICGGM